MIKEGNALDYWRLWFNGNKWIALEHQVETVVWAEPQIKRKHIFLYESTGFFSEKRGHILTVSGRVVNFSNEILSGACGSTENIT